MGRPRSIRLSCLAAAVVAVLTACGSAPDRHTTASALDDDAVTVASFDFPESRLLAEIYGEALRAAGYRVRLQLGAGSRELVDPALGRGLVELVPEYAGTALEFLTLGEVASSQDAGRNHDELVRTLRPRDLVPLAPAPAQDANAFVVTRTTAERYRLRDLSDLRAVAPRLRFGGPPECPTRPFCLPGLRRTYGLRFDSFLPLDAGGPITHQALEQSHVDVALLFSTDPALADRGLVELRDDRSLQPAENVTPLVHREVVRRWGADLTDTVDAASRRLSTATLRSLNGRVAGGREDAHDVAVAWLREVGLA